MNRLLKSLKAAYPQFRFKSGEIPFWSPKEKTVYYTQLSEDESVWGLLHETGHALLSHQNFTTDADLLRKELDAWARANLLALHYDLHIPDEHIQDCLDSYRDWLHKRSMCPTCDSHGVQSPDKAYRCLNCNASWNVSTSNTCRPYRRSKSLITK
jgi:hypothetical protein